MDKHIVFQVANSKYAINATYIQSIEHMQKITRLPGAPHFVKGVMNIRGVILPVIDLCAQFGLGESQFTPDTRIIILSKDDISAGIIIDSTDTVIEIDTSVLQPFSNERLEDKFIEGLALTDQGTIVVLDVAQILGAESQQLDTQKGA